MKRNLGKGIYQTGFGIITFFMFVGFAMAQPIIPGDQLFLNPNSNTDEVRFFPSAHAVSQMDSKQTLTVEQLALPNSQQVDLVLTPFELFSPTTCLMTTSDHGDMEIPLPDMRFFYGHVPGDETSFVYLCLQKSSMQGYIRYQGNEYDIAPVPDSQTGEHAIFTSTFVPEAIRNGQPFCESDDLLEMGSINREEIQQPGRTRTRDELLIAPIGIETDYETFEHFNNSTSETIAYVAALMGAVSATYQSEIDIQLQVNFWHIWTTPNDPYFDEGSGSQTAVRLQQVRSHCQAEHADLERTVFHLICKANFGGRAYLNALCSTSIGYGVSGIHGSYTYPNSSRTWDWNVVAHELGHNFGSHHTHCTVSPFWETPLDSCYSGEGGCYTGPEIPRDNASLMSYCHLGPGSIGLTFGHQPVRDVIRARAEAAACILSSDPEISVSPTAHDFDNVTTGHYALQEFELSNPGQADLTISSIAATSNSPFHFNHVRNSGFEHELSGEWHQWTWPDAGMATLTRDNTTSVSGQFSGRLDVLNSTLNWTDAQQGGSWGGIAITAGQTYRVSFWAKSSTPTEISVNVGENHDPWGWIGLGGTANLDSEWRHFSYQYVAENSGDNTRLVLGINQPGQTLSVWLDDVLMTADPPSFALTPGQLEYFDVAFTPTESSYFSDNLVIQSDAADQPQLSIPLTGTGEAPAELPFPGNAMHCDDVVEYARIPDHPTLDVTDAFTIEALVYLEAASSTAIRKEGAFLLEFGDAGTIENGRFLNTFIWTQDGELVGTQTGWFPFPMNHWHHLAFTFDGTWLKLYINGVLINSRQLETPQATQVTETVLTIGSFSEDERYFGSLDEVRLWNTARSQSQIENFMCQSLPTPQNGLVGYWKFDDSLIAFDNSGHQNHGQYQGSPTILPSTASANCDDYRPTVQVSPQAYTFNPVNYDDYDILEITIENNSPNFLQINDVSSDNNNFVINNLRNGGFEQGTEGWWPCCNETGTQLGIDTGTQVNGNQSLRYDILDDGVTWASILQTRTDMRVEAGQEYTLRFWAKASQAGTLLVYFQQDYEPWESLGIYNHVAVTNSWTPYEMTFTAPITESLCKLGFSPVNPSAGLSLWLDDVCLDADTRPKIVGPFSTFPKEIRFAPQQAGNHTATVEIQSNAVNQPMISIPLSGQGLASQAVVTPTNLSATVAAGQTVDLQLTIGNNGNGALEFEIGRENLLMNPGFEDGVAGWVEEDHLSHGYIYTDCQNAHAGDCAALAEVLAPFEYNWQFKLYQTEIEIEPGQTYTIDFWARANEPYLMAYEVAKLSDDWRTYSGTAYADLTTDWQHFTHTFTVDPDETPEPSDTRLGFSLGDSPGQVWFDQVAVYPSEVIDWISTQPESGTLTPGGSQLIDVHLNAENLTSGTYQTQLQITTNDPDQAQIEVPVQLTVQDTAADNFLISMNDNMQAGPNQSVMIPVLLENPDQVPIEGIDLVIQYDPGILQLNNVSLDSGVLAGPDYTLQIGGDPGLVSISLYAVGDLFNGSGEILHLEMLTSGTPGACSDLILTLAEINETAVPTSNGQLCLTISSFAISGQILYYSDTIPVPLTQMTLSGDTTETRWTDSSGQFSFESVDAGDYQLSAQKADDLGGLSATDASRIARYAAGTYSFTCEQQIAADVSQNGAISALDASRVARYRAQLLDCMNDTCQDWVFVVPPCEFPTYSNYRAYLPLDADQSQQDFAAIRLGDVTGNWLPEPTRAALLSGQPTHPARAEQPIGQQFRIPIWLAQNEAIEGVDLEIEYDPEIVIDLSLSLEGSILDDMGYSIQTNLTDNQLVAAIFATTEIVNGMGALVYLECAIHDYNPSGNLWLNHFDVNEAPAAGGFLVNRNDAERTARELQFVPPVLHPAETRLYPNFPNPFNPNTQISFALAVDSQVNLAIYDVSGRLIRMLVDGQMDSGRHQVNWDGRNDRGETVSSGVYFYRLVTDYKSLTRRMALIR